MLPPTPAPTTSAATACTLSRFPLKASVGPHAGGRTLTTVKHRPRRRCDVPIKTWGLMGKGGCLTWLLQTALETAAAVWLHFPRRGSMLIALAEGLGEVPKQPWTQILLTSWSYLFSSTSFSSSRSLSRLPLSSPPNSVILSVSALLSRLDFSLPGCSAPVGN